MKASILEFSFKDDLSLNHLKTINFFIFSINALSLLSKVLNHYWQLMLLKDGS